MVGGQTTGKGWRFEMRVADRRGRGYAASVAGTLVGALVGVVAGYAWALAILSNDEFPDHGVGIVLVLYLAVLCTPAAAAIGCWVALRAKRYPSAGRTAAVLLEVIAVVLLPTTLWDIEVLLRLGVEGALVAVLAPLFLAPILARYAALRW